MQVMKRLGGKQHKLWAPYAIAVYVWLVIGSAIVLDHGSVSKVKSASQRLFRFVDSHFLIPGPLSV